MKPPIAWGDFLGDMPTGMPAHGWSRDDPNYAKWYRTYQGPHKDSLPPPDAQPGAMDADIQELHRLIGAIKR